MGLFDSITGGYTNPPLTSAGQFLQDETKNLYGQAGALPTTKVNFGGNTFEILPKAEKDRLKLQLAMLGAMGGAQGTQTLDPGLLGRLGPLLALYMGAGGGGKTPTSMPAIDPMAAMSVLPNSSGGSADPGLWQTFLNLFNSGGGGTSASNGVVDLAAMGSSFL
jgi:hypothetical protein